MMKAPLTDRSETRKLADPTQSRAVLIGVSAYKNMDDIPAASANLSELRCLLADPEIWGLPDENCTVIGQSELCDTDGRVKVLDAIHEAASECRDTLIIYYTGHGLVSPDGKLLLALPATDRSRPYTSISFDDIRAELGHARRIRKLVILDCCFAARAMNGGMGADGTQALYKLAETPGAYILAAAAANEEALAPVGDNFTIFSGELFRLLRFGAAEESDLWDVASIFEYIHRQLGRQGKPLPELLDHNRGSKLYIARNIGHRVEWVLPPQLEALFRAQVRSADGFMYRITGTHRSMIDVYVRQDLRARTARAKSDLATEASIHSTKDAALQHGVGPPERIQDVLSEHRHFLVIGGPGLGKSTQSVQLAAQLAQPWLDGEYRIRAERIIPLRVVASVLAASDASLEEALIYAARAALGKFADRPLSPEIFGLAPASSEWLVIVDGIDEIADAASRQRLLNLIRRRINEPGNRFRFLVTTRPLAPNELVGFGSADSRYFLQPFDLERLSEFAHLWFKDSDNCSAEGYLAQVSAAGLYELVQIPLLATISAVAYESDPSRPLPANRFGLYEKYLHYLASERVKETSRQWVELKDQMLAASPNEIRAVESLFSRRMELVYFLAESAADKNVDLVAAALRWANREVGAQAHSLADEWRELVASILNSTGMFSYESGQLAFIHASFGDHLSAKSHALRLPSAFSLRKYPEWYEVLRAAQNPLGERSRALLTHYCYLHPDSHDILDFLQKGEPQDWLLAGNLLAEGVPSASAHRACFLQQLVAVIAGREDGDAVLWLTVGGRISDEGVHSFLRSVASGRAPATNHEVRIAAAVALREIDRSLAIATLRDYLYHAESVPALQMAGFALAGFGRQYIVEVVRVFVTFDGSAMQNASTEILVGLRRQQAQETIDALHELLNDRSGTVWRNAAVALAVIEPGSCPTLISRLVKTGDRSAHFMAMHMFERLPVAYVEDVMRVVKPLLKHREPGVRRAAALVTCAVDDLETASGLKALLLDRDPGVREGAIEAMGLWPIFDVYELFDHLGPSKRARLVNGIQQLGSHGEGIIVDKLCDITPRDRPRDALMGIQVLLELDARYVEKCRQIAAGLASIRSPRSRANCAVRLLGFGLKWEGLAEEAIHGLAANEEDYGEDSWRLIAEAVLKFTPNVAARYLLELWSSWSELTFDALALALHTRDPSRRAAVIAALRLGADRGQFSQNAEVCIEALGEPLARQVPELSYIDTFIASLRADFARLGPEDLVEAVEMLRYELSDADTAIVDAVGERLALMGTFYASAFTLAFPPVVA